MTAPYRKKLIEVALPLEAINRESAREKSIRHGHPSTLHLWWARRPLAAARAIIFAQLVDDPSAWPERFPTEEDQENERKRLFTIIENMVAWEHSNDDAFINPARFEIAQSWARSHPSPASSRILQLSIDDPTAVTVVDQYLVTDVPAIHDPFAGGGSIPLEAQRLGLRAVASDLNPVAVVINKALIELPPRFADRAPIHPDRATAPAKPTRQRRLAVAEKVWRGGEGLAADIRHYGMRVSDEARRRIGAFYPDAEITKDVTKERPDLAAIEGKKLTVIAWLWARTVASPDPAFAGIHVPLVSSFWLAQKEGKEAWVDVVVDKADPRRYSFVVRRSSPKDKQTTSAGTKVDRGGFRCVLSGSPITFDYVRDEASAGRMGTRLMAVVAEGRGERVYLSPNTVHETAAASAKPSWFPDGNLPNEALGFRVQRYGLRKWEDLFSQRQTLALSTFSDVVRDLRTAVVTDAVAAGLKDDGVALRDGGNGATAYADAIVTYLACALSRAADFWCSIATWSPVPKNEVVCHAFTKQAIPMTWDFGEVNPFSSSGGNFVGHVDFVAKVPEKACPPRAATAEVRQASAQERWYRGPVAYSTDPPYYDNIGYADLSDFFYVWMRHTLRDVWPAETSTLLVPKKDELVADPHRHGGKDAAEHFFLDGMTQAIRGLREASVPDVPAAIYYAFKQTESGGDGTSSTGWETFLEAVLRAGYEIRGTWPIRTERAGRSRDIGSNALATSVVLALTGRSESAVSTTRNDFRRQLRLELPAAIRALQQSRIAPVDVAQAAIGPGMAVFSRYSRVLEPDGAAMSVRDALRLINEVLDEHLVEQEGEFDPDTRFAVTWYEQHAFDAGAFGEAETLAKARAVAVDGIEEAGILRAAGGKVRLLKRSELPEDWDPLKDTRLTIWEATQHLIKRLEQKGEESAAALMERLGRHAESARDLAYRLYNTCERKGWADEARAYNGLVAAWPDLERLAAAAASAPAQQNLL